MEKKSLFFLLFVMCVGWFIPKGVFAKVTNYYDSLIDIDYRIKDDQNRTNLNYKLYDKNKAINLESVYDFSNNTYNFIINQSVEERNNVFSKLVPGVTSKLDLLEQKTKFYEDDYKNIFTSDEILKLSSCASGPGSWGGYGDTYYSDTPYYCSAYGIIPLILEKYENNKIIEKKIVFGSIHNGLFLVYNGTGYENAFYHDYFSLSLVNNNMNEHKYEEYAGWTAWASDNICINPLESNNNPDNIQFMTNAMYDYSDGLWEELNSKKITSSEINSFVEEYLKTNTNKSIYSKYNSNVNYRFKVKNGNGIKFNLHDISNTFSFNSIYDKESDTYSIVDNSSDSDYQDGIKEFSKIIIDEVKNGNFSELANKYKSITSDNCTSTNCNIYTYIPLVLEGETKDNYAKQIVLGLVNVQYREENGNDYYDIGLNIYNNTCELLNSSIDADMNKLINLSRSVEKDYSNNLINQYSDGSISINDIYEEVDVNTLKEKYCNDVPVISLRRNPKTLNNGVIVLIISMMIVIGSSVFIIKKRSVKI